MKRTRTTWNILTLLPMAVAIVIAAEWERVLELCRSIALQRPEDNRLAGAEQTASSTPQLKAEWCTVTENGKRQLRMRWRVPANTRAGHNVA